MSPIRDAGELGATEDLDRQPDGVPHDVVGRTVFAAYVLSVLGLAICATAGWRAALGGAVIAMPILVIALQRRAARDRDRLHPSR